MFHQASPQSILALLALAGVATLGVNTPVLPSPELGVAASLAHVSPQLVGDVEMLAHWIVDPSRRQAMQPEQVDALLVMRSAGESRDRRHVAALWRIADGAAASPKDNHFALEALDALWRLGEPASAFQERIADCVANPERAYLAALVAARTERLDLRAAIAASATLAEQKQVTGAHMLRWADLRARTVTYTSAKLFECTTAAARVDLLAPLSLGGYTPLMAVEKGIESPFDRGDGAVAWARARLAEFSAVMPAEAARALTETQFNGAFEHARTTEGRERLLNACRDYAAQFLAPTALAQYRALRPAEPAHR